MRFTLTYSSFFRVTLSLLVLGVFLKEPARAQGQPVQLPPTAGETVFLYCDREIYGAGEQIHFFASYREPGEFKSGSWSSVLYVELISWDGNKRASSKVLIKEGRAIGTTKIPGTIPSGNYYLRAYTKWMRNYSPSKYAYLPLTILNPNSQEMLAAPEEGNGSLSIMERMPDRLSGEIVLSGFKDQYGTGEEVDIEIQIPEDQRSGTYSLSIAKTRDQSSADYEWEHGPKEENGPETIEFLPEINGLTLSGRIIDSESNEPVDRARLQLSSYADPFLYAEVLSGMDGAFLYAFPYFTGNQELHIAEGSDSSGSHKILLASEFCNKPVYLPHVPVLIDTAEQSLIKEILVNAQLKERYNRSAGPSDQEEKSYPSFYGNGASVTYVRDYIELTNLEEFVYEIIPQVSVRSSGLGSAISIQGPDCLDIYPPLVLVDNIPVSNNEELLRIPSNRVERIEVLNQAYMVGNTRYSGIFSIYSNKKDMAGLSQEQDPHFFSLQMLDHAGLQNSHLTYPVVSTSPRISNLLYWEPGIRIPEEGTIKINLSTPDTPGSYVLTFRGTGQAGEARVLHMARFSVK